MGEYPINDELTTDAGGNRRPFKTEVKDGKVVHTKKDPIPRPTRVGLPIRSWELWHLAILWAIYTIYDKKNLPTLYRNHYPELVSAREARTGIHLTDGAIRDRIDKGHREQEYVNYKHLVPDAILNVQEHIK